MIGIKITITSEELNLIRKYADFNRTEMDPCLHTCSSMDRAVCCGCYRKTEYDKKLTVYRKEIEPIIDIIDNPYVQDYINAYNRLCEADRELKKAENLHKHATDMFHLTENKFTVIEEEKEND